MVQDAPDFQDGLIGECEKHKDSVEYKRAVEEEWASRQRQLLKQVEDKALEDSLRILAKFEDVRNSFSLEHAFRYDVAVDVAMDVAPEVQWLSEDKYKNLKVVVEIDEIVDVEKAAKIELKRHHKALGLLRIVTDRGLQDEDAGQPYRMFM